MNIEITPKQLFLVEKYLDENLRPKEDKQMSVEDRQRLSFDVTEPIKNLIRNGFNKNFSKYGEIYSEVEIGTIGLRKLIDNNSQIIKDAIKLYKAEQEENLYLTLLDKKVGDMTGYEIKVLYSFIKL